MMCQLVTLATPLEWVTVPQIHTREYINVTIFCSHSVIQKRMDVNIQYRDMNELSVRLKPAILTVSFILMALSKSSTSLQEFALSQYCRILHRSTVTSALQLQDLKQTSTNNGQCHHCHVMIVAVTTGDVTLECQRCTLQLGVIQMIVVERVSGLDASNHHRQQTTLAIVSGVHPPKANDAYFRLPLSLHSFPPHSFPHIPLVFSPSLSSPPSPYN